MKVEARGQTSVRKQPELLALNLATVIDLLWFFGLWAIFVRVGRLAPIPGARSGFFFGVTYGLTLITQFQLLKATFGQWVWKLGFVPTGKPRQFRLVQKGILSAEVRVRAAAFSALFLLVSGFVVARDLLAHPMIQRVSIESMPPLVPSQSEQARKEWATVPFFYAFGAWPKRVFGDPVFYSLPYERGPPTLFLGKIIARWKMPDIQLTIEGPKTPSKRASPQEIKACFLAPFITCPGLRKAVLERHVDELLAAGAEDWQISWFEVQNPPRAAPEHPPEGIRLVAYGHSKDRKGWAQERWILVTPQGTHQTLILQRSLGSEGEEASHLLRKLIQTLRVSDSLGFGQTLATLRVSETDLGRFQNSLESPDLSLELADAQAALLAKASVEPADLNTYLHLGGTSLLLLKHVLAIRKQMSASPSSALNDKLLSLTQEWTAAAKPMILAAERYAEDIAPDDRRTAQLKDMLKESETVR